MKNEGTTATTVQGAIAPCSVGSAVVNGLGSSLSNLFAYSYVDTEKENLKAEVLFLRKVITRVLEL